jgi:hypothetical protein
MITTQHIEETLSRAYVRAIAATAGVIVNVDELDYGCDGAFRSVTWRNSRRVVTGFSIDFQLKASIRWSETATEIAVTAR